MKISFPQIDYVFSLEKEGCLMIVLENQRLLGEILTDFSQQLQGLDGRIVLSRNNKILPIQKHAELLSQIIPFDINQKMLVNKANAQLQQIAVNGENYLKTNELLGIWEKYLLELSLGLTGDFSFTRISAESLIKAAGIEFADDYDNLGEKLLDYMNLVQSYDKEKLFIYVNLRSYLTDTEMEEFSEDVAVREMRVLLLESLERSAIKGVRQYIVDDDLCVIC